jgi:murein L,D-transpeptidase YcbB/YkuD
VYILLTHTPYLLFLFFVAVLMGVTDCFSAPKPPQQTLSSIEASLMTEKAHYAELSKKHSKWPAVTCLNITFKAGMKDPIITVAREQLTRMGYLKSSKESPASNKVLDEPLKAALVAFQKKHALSPDGAYGYQTCKALNISAQQRVSLIEKSIAHIQAEKATWTGRRILVNIPTYTLFALKDGAIEHTQPVIVGMPTRPTPTIHTPMVQVVFNPSWGVPNSILVKDKLKKIQSDPTYLERFGYQVFDENDEEVEPNTIDWHNISETDFPYRIRQSPGPQNALGNIKFVLINDQAIYMHGTPDVNLFNKGMRALSSGCVRLKDPMGLALWALRGEHTEDELKELLATDSTEHMMIKPAIDVHMIDLPVFVDAAGQVVFGGNPYHKHY